MERYLYNFQSPFITNFLCKNNLHLHFIIGGIGGCLHEVRDLLSHANTFGDNVADL